jgi:hypothetical protein
VGSGFFCHGAQKLFVTTGTRICPRDFTKPWYFFFTVFNICNKIQFHNSSTHVSGITGNLRSTFNCIHYCLRVLKILMSFPRNISGVKGQFSQSETTGLYPDKNPREFWWPIWHSNRCFSKLFGIFSICF